MEVGRESKKLNLPKKDIYLDEVKSEGIQTL